MIRVATFLLALCGLYPQYRAVKTVLIGRGWLPGDWETEHKYNNRNIYVIEPLVESLLQVKVHSHQMTPLFSKRLKVTI